MTDQVKSAQRMDARGFAARISTFKGTIWYADLPEHQSFDDCMEPTFWRDIVPVKRPQLMDEVEVFKADTMSVRKYLVVGVGPGFMKLSQFQQADGPVAPEVKKGSPLATRWNPGKKGHEVVRDDGAAKTVMAGPFQTKPEAVEWISDHLKAMAA